MAAKIRNNPTTDMAMPDEITAPSGIAVSAGTALADQGIPGGSVPADDATIVINTNQGEVPGDAGPIIGPEVETPIEQPTPLPPPIIEIPDPIQCDLTVIMLPPGTKITGFMGQMRSAHVEFPSHLCDRFRRLVAGLHNSHATYPGPGGKRVHVDSAADAMRWLISRLPE